MEIGKDVTFINSNKLKNGTVSWKIGEQLHVTDEKGDVHKIEVQHVVDTDNKTNTEDNSSETK